jgi:quercetin dioxygenase-like cupin family protein
VKISDIPFVTTDWASVEPTRHSGDEGVALWRTQTFGPEDNKIRVRMVDYSPGYVSDHWCQKGHILLVLEGELETTLADGRHFLLGPGMSYQVADGAEAHMSRSAKGATIFIVD